MRRASQTGNGGQRIVVQVCSVRQPAATLRCAGGNRPRRGHRPRLNSWSPTEELRCFGRLSARGLPRSELRRSSSAGCSPRRRRSWPRARPTPRRSPRICTRWRPEPGSRGTINVNALLARFRGQAPLQPGRGKRRPGQARANLAPLARPRRPAKCYAGDHRSPCPTRSTISARRLRRPRSRRLNPGRPRTSLSRPIQGIAVGPDEADPDRQCVLQLRRPGSQRHHRLHLHVRLLRAGQKHAASCRLTPTHGSISTPSPALDRHRDELGLRVVSFDGVTPASAMATSTLQSRTPQIPGILATGLLRIHRALPDQPSFGTSTDKLAFTTNSFAMGPGGGPTTRAAPAAPSAGVS